MISLKYSLLVCQWFRSRVEKFKLSISSWGVFLYLCCLRVKFKIDFVLSNRVRECLTLYCPTPPCHVTAHAHITHLNTPLNNYWEIITIRFHSSKSKSRPRNEEGLKLDYYKRRWYYTHLDGEKSLVYSTVSGWWSLVVIDFGWRVDTIKQMYKQPKMKCHRPIKARARGLSGMSRMNCSMKTSSSRWTRSIASCKYWRWLPRATEQLTLSKVV